MEISIKGLHEKVALKLDNDVYLDKSNVAKVIEDNSELFKNLDIAPINNSKMLFGYNALNQPIKIAYEQELIIRIVILTKEIDYKRFVGQITYDGHHYSGFQIQKDNKTIQGELTKVYRTVEKSNEIVQGCSRTDTGVHALNYYLHFDSRRGLSEDKWLAIFKRQLPKDIRINSLKEIHPLFHSRYDVQKKHYIYRIKLNELNPFRLNYEWNVTSIDIDLLNKNIQQLVGTHDFASFCKGDPNSTIRTIFETKASCENDVLTLEFIGNGFLRYMIRIIVHALINISTYKLELDILDIINLKSRAYTKDLAPASGLYLKEIYY